MTTSSFAPSLSSILAKEMGDSRASKDHKPRKSTKDEVEGKDPGTAEVAGKWWNETKFNKTKNKISERRLFLSSGP